MLDEKRQRLINFIKKNPNTTHREIRKNLRLNPNRIFNSLEEAFKEAGVKPPRTYKIKTKAEKKQIIIDYIRKNPGVGGHTIAKETKINLSSVFNDIKEAYDKASVKYPRRIDKRTREEKIKQIIELVRRDPLISIDRIYKKSNTNPYKFFRNF
jgi:predicted transcriptional regulator